MKCPTCVQRAEKGVLFTTVHLAVVAYLRYSVLTQQKRKQPHLFPVLSSHLTALPLLTEHLPIHLLSSFASCMISSAWEGVDLSQDLSEHDSKTVRMCWCRRNTAVRSFLEVLCSKCCKQRVVFLTEFAAAPVSSVRVDRCKRSWAILPQRGPALGPAGWWLPANTTLA